MKDQQPTILDSKGTPAIPPVDSVRAKIFGVPINVTGINAIVVILLACALGALGYLLWERTQTSDEHLEKISSQHALEREKQTLRMTSEHHDIVQGLHDLKDVNEAINESIKVQNYINLADEKKRQEIKNNLDMPATLQRRMGGREYR